MKGEKVLKLVAPAPVHFCMPWHARGWEDEPEHGAVCCFCQRDVAAPESARGKTVSCIYCGMERALVPLVEREHDWSTQRRGDEGEDESTAS